MFMISSRDFTRSSCSTVTVVVTGHSSRRSPPPRCTPTGNGLQRGQFCRPPPGRTVRRQQAATWPPLGRISWPPTPLPHAPLVWALQSYRLEPEGGGRRGAGRSRHCRLRGHCGVGCSHHRLQQGRLGLRCSIRGLPGRDGLRCSIRGLPGRLGLRCSICGLPGRDGLRCSIRGLPGRLGLRCSICGLPGRDGLRCSICGLPGRDGLGCSVRLLGGGVGWSICWGWVLGGVAGCCCGGCCGSRRRGRRGWFRRWCRCRRAIRRCGGTHSGAWVCGTARSRGRVWRWRAVVGCWRGGGCVRATALVRVRRRWCR